MKRSMLVVLAVSLGTLTMASRGSAADFDAKIVDIDGAPLKGDNGQPVDLTVRKVVVESLMTSFQDEPGLTGEEKIRRFELARKINSKDPAADALPVEDIALIKKLVNKRYASPLVVSEAWRALENSPEKK